MEFSKVFHQTSPEEIRRFDLLKRDYVAVRYSDDYMITKEDLDYLSKRVQVLRKFTEGICKEKIANFTK